MIIPLSLMIWFAQSGIEYKAVKSWSFAQRHFHGVKGMLISAAISGIATIGSMRISATYAAAFAIAGVFGLFTNQFTYNMFAAIERTMATLKIARTSFGQWVNTNIEIFRRVWRTIQWGVRTVAAAIVLIFKIIGYPLQRWEQYQTTRTTTTN